MFKFNFRKPEKEVIAVPEDVAPEPVQPKPAYIGDQYVCPICDTNLAYFLPVDNSYLALLDKYEYNYSLFHDETFNMLQYSCPACGASDRDRLYAMYFLERMNGADANRKLNFIDFAPADVSYFYKKFPFLNYRSADLYMEGVDDKVDITGMKIYANSSVDIFLCSHVLEHIEDDRKAMSELYRILKPGGWGITMVPILAHQDKIIEDLPITSEADKWRYYGQGDHVRYYNRSGFVERLQGAGFKVNLLGVDHFGPERFEKYGIHPRSILYIVEKL
jgi:SAM-dependent methyltransferase